MSSGSLSDTFLTPVGDRNAIAAGSSRRPSSKRAVPAGTSSQTGDTFSPGGHDGNDISGSISLGRVFAHDDGVGAVGKRGPVWTQIAPPDSSDSFTTVTSGQPLAGTVRIGGSHDVASLCCPFVTRHGSSGRH